VIKPEGEQGRVKLGPFIRRGAKVMKKGQGANENRGAQGESKGVPTFHGNGKFTVLRERNPKEFGESQ